MVVGDRQPSAVTSMIGHCVVVTFRELLRQVAVSKDCRMSRFDPIAPTICSPSWNVR
jgi:hypothetical protein